MSEAEHIEETRRWLRYAQEDLVAAEAMLSSSETMPRHVCWLAQQAVEKAIKAILIFLQIDFPYTHDLDVLRNLVPDGWQLKADYPDLAELTEWAVEARYPGSWPDATETDAHAAARQARNVWDAVNRDLMGRGL